MKKSLYELAGVPPAAPAAVIEMAIKRRLQKLQDSGDPNASAEVYALREAWSVLGDAKKRAAYDAKLGDAAEKAAVAQAKAAAAEAKAAKVAKAAPAPPSVASVPLPPPEPEVDLGPIVIVQAATAVSRAKYYALGVVAIALALGGAWYTLRSAKPVAPGAKAAGGRTTYQPAPNAEPGAAPKEYYQRPPPVQGQRYPRPGMDSVSEQPGDPPAAEKSDAEKSDAEKPKE